MRGPAKDGVLGASSTQTVLDLTPGGTVVLIFADTLTRSPIDSSRWLQDDNWVEVCKNEVQYHDQSQSCVGRDVKLVLTELGLEPALEMATFADSQYSGMATLLNDKNVAIWAKTFDEGLAYIGGHGGVRSQVTSVDAQPPIILVKPGRPSAAMTRYAFNKAYDVTPGQSG